MPRLELALEIEAPVEIVFDLARNIDVHQLSQVRHRERAVAGRVSGLIEEGETVTWEAVHLGVRQRLTSRITTLRRPGYFQDTMVHGAFTRFVHDHHFTALAARRTLMRDVFDYTAPLGPLGRLADFLFLERYVRRLLAERNDVIQRLAEATPQSAATGG